MVNARGVTCFGAFLLVVAGLAQFAVAQDAAEKQMMIEKGLQYDTAWELYQALVEEADGGTSLDWTNLPDWTGVYTRTRGGLNFDPDQLPDGLPTAKLTPDYHASMMDRIEKTMQGIQFDPISTCASPGHPRWLSMPFLREHIVTPLQTTMIAEAYNSVRRIYTDGRGHMPADEQYPLHNGDSVGIWDGHRLIFHTEQLMAHYYERTQPDYSEEVETVEIWEKADDRTLVAHVWIYDPPVLVEPWYTKQSFTKLTDPEGMIRVRHWACKGNPNNDVYMTEDGNSNFVDFTFTDMDDQ